MREDNGIRGTVKKEVRSMLNVLASPLFNQLPLIGEDRIIFPTIK